MAPKIKPPSLTKPDRHYDFRALNVVFAFSSLALLAVTPWMVFADYAKPWKKLQAEFRGRERQTAVELAEKERGEIDPRAVATVEQDIVTQQARLDEPRAEVSELEGRLGDAEDRVYELDANWRTTKSYLDTTRYQFGEAVHAHSAGEEELGAEVAALTERFGQDKLALEEARRIEGEIKEQLVELRGARTEAEKRLAALNLGLSNVEQRVAELDKDLGFFVLNAPFMDMLEPSLRIEQAILDGLYQDINFTNIGRVDRCVTCHVAANRPGFRPEDAPENDPERWEVPFASHPRLDVFVGDSSPHPYRTFGCTICHQGLDRATDFARAGHSPISEEQRQEWVDDWDWEKQPFLDHPILPNGTAEAGCLSCHASEIWTPGSETLEVGRQLINKMGCDGCHAIDLPAFTDLRKAGPDLTKIATKTSPEWAYKWIESPRDFRPTTWMPHFFYEENIKGEVNLERQKAEISALVTFLWDSSEEGSYSPAPRGDAERGKALFESVGCTGCHLLDPEASREDYFPEINRLHGPNLVRTGSKVSSGWLYDWVRDPASYWHDTNMPDLRLTDGEAADVTAYLMAQRDAAFEDLAMPAAPASVRDDLLMTYLTNNNTIVQSQEMLEAMDNTERDVFLGRETVSKYGCYGCHEIRGFEDAKPIGTELTEEGSKPVHQLDFGFVHDVEHTRPDWLRMKLKRPRIWDEGKEQVKNYAELYKMPNFGMSDREAEAVLANILGFTKESVVPHRRAGQGRGSDAVAAGRKLVTRFNCQGCHKIEGMGQAIRTAMDKNLLPPNLVSQGARTQSDWLFSFLHDPGQVSMRPWLTARMPTFGFSDDQVNALVGYFAALDEREPFESAKGEADARDRAVGAVVFNMLQCARCHPAGPDLGSGASASELAPSLLLARDRLRWDWVAEWIKDPQSWVPGTNMPTNFPVNAENGSYDSPLLFVYDTPMFASRKEALSRYFDSEDELKEYLGDADRVTAALRDHIWTLR